MKLSKNLMLFIICSLTKSEYLLCLWQKESIYEKGPRRNNTTQRNKKS